MDDALWQPGLFHLTSVPVGRFNWDTTQYYEWLIEYVRWRYSESNAGDFDFEGHVYSQFLMVVDNPSSEVALALSIWYASTGANSVGDEFAFYMRYLYLPTQFVTGSFWSAGKYARRALEIEFRNVENEYAAARYNDPNHVHDFPAFLRLNPDYRPWGLDDNDSTASASPTTTPASTSTTESPTDGSILYARPLTEWFEEDTGEGWFAVEGETFHIGMYLGDGRTREAWTAEDGFGDISASVNVRQVSSNTNSGGCLAVRQHVDEGEYQLCILNNGHTWATYDYVDSGGKWHSEELLPAVEHAGVNPSSAWNELKVIARGNELWFLVNGQLIGSITHGGRTSGHVAIQVTNWGTDTVEWEFDSLIVRAVE